MKIMFKIISILSMVTISAMADDICYEKPYVENSSLNILCKDVLDIKNDICKNAPSSSECSQWTSNWINKCENNEISIKWKIGGIHYNKTMSCSNIFNNLFASWIPFNIRASFRDACNNHSVAISFPRNVVPIKALKNIEDVTVSYAIHGFAISSPLSSIGIDDKIKTKVNDLIDNGDPILRANTETSFDLDGLIKSSNFGFFNHGIEYHLGDMNKNDIHNTWTQELPLITMINNFFSHSIFYAHYTKNGKTYNLNINPCKDSGINVPEARIDDSVLPVPQVDTLMSFHITINGKLDNGVTLDNNSYLSYKTENGSLKAGIDYIPKSGILVIPQGTKSVDINILIKANIKPGRFYIILNNGYGIIRNNDKGTGILLYRSLNNSGSKFWAGVGIDNSKNDIHKNTTSLDVKKDNSVKKQLYNKMNW